MFNYKPYLTHIYNYFNRIKYAQVQLVITREYYTKHTNEC